MKYEVIEGNVYEIECTGKSKKYRFDSGSNLDLRGFDDYFDKK